VFPSSMARRYSNLYLTSVAVCCGHCSIPSSNLLVSLVTICCCQFVIQSCNLLVSLVTIRCCQFVIQSCNLLVSCHSFLLPVSYKVVISLYHWSQFVVVSLLYKFVICWYSWSNSLLPFCHAKLQFLGISGHCCCWFVVQSCNLLLSLVSSYNCQLAV
jgi:hypothetical protein